MISVPVSQDLIGQVDVKTKTVHFYVQRESNFDTPFAISPFDVAPVNEGGAFNLTSGIFTVPVPGIYHFDFSALKSAEISTYLSIYLQVNGADVGAAFSFQSATGSEDVVSLNASLQLEAGDKVNLYNFVNGAFIDDISHRTHFSGWLVEEKLM